MRRWKRNEWFVYLTNFLHMTMYTMCLGGIFDIFLYSISQEQKILLIEPLTIGHGSPLQPPVHIDTFANFELTFDIWPSRDKVHYASNSTCLQTYTCASSIIHFTDGCGNGDCCRVGNRMPALFFFNGTTRLILMMDAVGQDETMDRQTYWKMQQCFMTNELPVETWSSIKVKATGVARSKGQFGNSSDGGIALFVNGKKTCEVPGTAYHDIPSRTNASAYLGALHGYAGDLHTPANAQLRQVKYGKPASNFFVGLVNSAQGVLSIFVMYPIGWLGDRFNRYNVLRANMTIGLAAGCLLAAAVFYSSVPFLILGVCVFTLYQQCISSIIYAVLADNVLRKRRTRAGVNYKTFSALAMSFAPAIQWIVVTLGPSTDSWTKKTFDLLLLPGWLLLPAIGLSACNLAAVGRKISAIPNVDEVHSSSVLEHATRTCTLSPAWLDQRVCCSQKRRFIVATAVNVFFIGTLLANGMTVRYFSLYFTQILKFSPANLCLLNAICRLWIAGFAQVGKPLATLMGRSNLAVVFHLGSALFTFGIYGAGLFTPSVPVACACYLMRFACLHARDPLLYSITMDCVPPSQRARWAALNSLRTLSFSASAVLGGYLADLHGYEFSFNITVVALLACTGLMLPALVWFPRSEGASARDDSLMSRLSSPASVT